MGEQLVLQWRALGRAIWGKSVISWERKRCPRTAGQARLELFIPLWIGRKVEDLKEVWVTFKDPVARCLRVVQACAPTAGL